MAKISILEAIEELTNGHPCSVPGRGNRRSGNSLKVHKNIGFLCNTGPDLLKHHKATKPAFNVGPPFLWRSAGGPMTARLKFVCFFGYTYPSTTIKRCLTWTPSDKTS